MPQDIQKGHDVADVYAAALFALASEAQQVDAVRDELAALAEAYAQNADFAAFLASAAVDDDARERSLDKMFRGRLSEMVLNTLLVMNRHGRAPLVPQLLRAFVLRLEEARGEIECTAVSAVALDAEQRAALEKTAEQLSGRKPLVEYRVEPEILGGLILRVGDIRFDNSLRRHLRELRVTLHERAERGVGIRSVVSA